MKRWLPLLLLGAAALLTAQLITDERLLRQGTLSATNLPVGKWKVEFANGVKEVCEIGYGGESSVVEPLRSSAGMAEAKDGVVVITFDDDRVERWIAVGRRFVVEHWFPGSRLPTVSPALGIAERTR